MFATKNATNKINKKMGSDMLTIYNVNQKPRNWLPNTYTVCSIDPGEVNFAIRVEHRSYAPTPEMKWKLVEYSVLLFDCVSVCGDSSVCVYSNITTFLDTYFDIIKKSNIFIIEKQLPINYPKVRINQHIVSWILFRFFDSEINPVIYDIHPKLKSGIFGLAKMKEYELKRKSVDIAKDILTQRCDAWSIEKIESNRNINGKLKPDDLADTVFQMEAFFKYVGFSDYSPPGRLMVPAEVLKILEGGM